LRPNPIRYIYSLKPFHS